MCGICCFIGNSSGVKRVLFGIRMLLNRGYDSTGICGILNNKFLMHKYASTKDVNCLDLLIKHQNEYINLSCPLIAHSRWATCGLKTNVNAHPHLDYSERFSLVHNGIIENHNEIRQKLIDEHKITFKSQTDTEVIINLISVFYDTYLDIQKAIICALNLLKGSWALAIMTILEPNKLYCVCNGSPLLIGYGDNFMMVASEQSGFSNYVKEYVIINDNDLIVLDKSDGSVNFNKKLNYIPKKITNEITEISPHPFPYWTLKEIYEQYDASIRALDNYSRICDDSTINLFDLAAHHELLENIDNLILLGCGTSFHAALFVSSLFKQISGINTIQVFDGAEFCEYDIPKKGKTALVFVSQSGETRDLYQCIPFGKKYDLPMIGIINVVDSLIARNMNVNIYLNCGNEIAVASTKAFTNQVIVLSLVAIWFSQNNKMNLEMRSNIIKSLRSLPSDIQTTINEITIPAENIANKLINSPSVFIIGKGNCETIAKEGALKIKEISYIHTEGYNSSSLKHGPFSLLVNKIPVIMIALRDNNFNKNMSVAEEIIARDTIIFGISDLILDSKFTESIKIPYNDVFGPVLANIALQLIAYKAAVLKKVNPDKPFNLAKVITV